MYDLSKDILEPQIRILIPQGVVTAPTHKSVKLERKMSEDAINFLKESCNYDENEIIQLESPTILSTKTTNTWRTNSFFRQNN